MIPVVVADPAGLAGAPQPGFRWYLNRRLVALYFGDPASGCWAYEIDLERCRTSAEVLDWIVQVSSKSWASDATVGELVRALADVLDPQATLCSFGRERGPLDVRGLLDATLHRGKGGHPRRLRYNVKPSPRERLLPRLDDLRDDA
jgi:hypothetical protein